MSLRPREGWRNLRRAFSLNLAHALTREAIFVGYGLECPTGTIEAIVETDDVGFAIIQCVEKIVDFISQGVVKHFSIWWDLVFVVHQIDEGRIFVVNRFVQRKYDRAVRKHVNDLVFCDVKFIGDFCFCGQVAFIALVLVAKVF